MSDRPCSCHPPVCAVRTSECAKHTLQKICTDGLIAQDDQWWDQIIWVIGARHHHLVTGDAEFAADAFRIGAASLDILRRDRFDSRSGLYRGPALTQDGSAGYPEPPYQLLAAEVGADPEPYAAQRAELVAAINDHLWSDKLGTYGYFLGPDGLDLHQETAGLALVIEFGIAEAERAAGIVGGTHREPFGVVNVWPHFARFSPPTRPRRSVRAQVRCRRHHDPADRADDVRR